MTLEEALLMFRKLKTFCVLCLGNFSEVTVSLKGTGSLREASDGIFFTVADANASLVFKVDADDILFWYSEPGELPDIFGLEVPKEAIHSICVCVALPLRASPPEISDPLAVPRRNKLFFFEFDDSWK